LVRLQKAIAHDYVAGFSLRVGEPSALRASSHVFRGRIAAADAASAVVCASWWSSKSSHHTLSILRRRP
jgi:hypothetical protein